MSEMMTAALHRAQVAERRESLFRHVMRKSSHPRWQKAVEWSGENRCPVPPGVVVSIWRKNGDAWSFRMHADRADWTEVRAYRLERGVPYPPTIPAPIPISPEIAGILHPALQFRFDRVDRLLGNLIETVARLNQPSGNAGIHDIDAALSD